MSKMRHYVCMDELLFHKTDVAKVEKFCPRSKILYQLLE